VAVAVAVAAARAIVVGCMGPGLQLPSGDEVGCHMHHMPCWATGVECTKCA
jgi:hypothetical protein